MPDGTALYECPAKSITPLTAVACGLFQQWEKGRPINATCLMDEPAALVEAMQLIGSEVAAFAAKESERGR